MTDIKIFIRKEKRKIMGCYTEQLANGTLKNETLGNESVTADSKWSANGKLSNNLISLFKEKAQKYNLDWRWLAALSYVESGWRTNVKNSYGYYGLFQFLDSTLNSGVKNNETRYSLTNPSDQAEVAAKLMAKRKSYANGKGLNPEDCYLYSGMAHNCGDGGAQFLLGKSSPKNVYQMTQVEKKLPSSEFKYKFMASSKKRKEISEYPFRMKSAYESICAKYK